MAGSDRQVRVGVGAFVLASRDEPSGNPRFLMSKRLGSHGAGTYALPGGHQDYGESPEQCAAREVWEETGLTVSSSSVRFLTMTNDYMPEEGRHYVTLFVVCVREDENAEPAIMEPDKSEGWEWVSWNDLVTLVKKQVEGSGEVERRPFLPLLNLIAQRPGMVPALS